MDSKDRRALKNEAANALAEASYNPKKLVLIYSGATLLLTALLMVIDFLLSQQIDSTGGLGGIGIRSVIATAQSALRLAQVAVLPFWQMGYLYTTLRISRKEHVGPSSLLEGFRRFGPVLRLTLLRSAIFIGIGILAANIASTVFFLTPFATTMLQQLEPILNDAALLENPTALQDAMFAATADAIVPMIIMYAVIFLIISAPFFYRYRMASYYLLDDENPRAMTALRSSRKLMRFLCIDLFKLDFSFWWFYILEALLSVICYGDYILQSLGISLPFSADVGYFIFFGIYLAGQLALYYWRKNELEVTYACTYHAWRDAHDPKQEPTPKNQPWVY